VAAGDALRLPFDDQQFDLVVCQFGVMFFPDKAAAFGEVQRVLLPGGTLLFSTWATVETHGFEAALLAGVERAFPDDPPTFVRAVQCGYSKLDHVAADLAAGGLVRVSAEEVTLVGQSSSAPDLARGYYTGTPLCAQIESRADLSASTLVVGQEMQRHLGDGAVTATMTAYLIEVRPGV
jgi:SAM-dependent methyltransferase